MRKILLSMLALLCVTTASTAQYAKNTLPAFVKKTDVKLATQASPLRATVGDAPESKTLKALAQNQKYMGPYETDEVATGRDGMGITIPGDYSAGCVLSPNYVSKYVGGQVVAIRFGLVDPIGASRVFMAPVTGDGYITEDVISQEVPSTQTGWNEVTLAEPYTITADAYSFMLGFDYTQKANSFPLSVVPASNMDAGWLIYGNPGMGLGWYETGIPAGYALSIQAVVQKDGGFHIVDLTLDYQYIPPFAQPGSPAVLSVGMSAFSGAQRATLGFSVNGKEIAEIEHNEELTVDITTKDMNVTYPQDLQTGENAVAVYVKKIDGQTPDVNYLTDDTVKYIVRGYTESLERQKQLIEQFTSQYCTACPLGYDVLNALIEQRDDLAWVAIHGDMGEQQRDEYTIEESAAITAFAISGFPSAALNRFYIPGEAALATGIGFYDAAQGATQLSRIIDLTNAFIPAFATVDITSSYEPATRELTITVSGEAVSDFKQAFGDAALTVYLTEDDIVSHQANPNGQWTYQYEHDRVLRDVLSDPLGDNLQWNGDRYEHTYQVTLDQQWDKANMDIVAFIARPIETVIQGGQAYFTTYIDEAYVTNANTAEVEAEDINAVPGVTVDDEAVEVARYTVDGRLITTPVKGINIIRLSDGRTLKVMVTE